MRNLMVLVLLVGSLQLSAQSSSYSSYSKVRFGLFFNPTLTWLKPSGSNVLKQKSRVGFNYGILLDFAFTDNYIMHTGVTVGQLYGGKLRYTPGTADSTFGYKIDYVELPIVFKMMTNEIGAMRYWGQFGLVNSFGFKDQVKITDNNNGETTPNATMPYETGFYNLALQVGGGIEYNISGNTSLVIGLVYRNGFMDVIKDNKQYPGKTFLNSLVFLTGVMF
jgi:hypothetical protein